MKTKFQLSVSASLVAMTMLFFISCKKQVPEGEIGSTSFKTKSRSVVPTAAMQNKFRVFGYFYRSDKDFSNYMDSLDLNQFTDVALSFVNPNNQGDFTVGSNISDAVVKGHNANVRMYFSFGGGGSALYFDTLLYAQNRTKFVSNIRKVATDHNFDGVDVDLEGERVTSNYNAFVMQLADTLHKYSKKLSISISTWKGAVVSDAAYAKIDYINSQSYGGPAEGGAGTRAPFSDFVNDFGYFKNTRGIPASKFNGGVPFYGDNFTSGASSGTISYKSIIAQFPYAYSLNYKYLDPYKVTYFDGHPRMRQKVEYALQQNMGGIMIWQILFDTKDNSSLARLINETAANNSGFNPSTNYYLLNRTSSKLMEVANASLLDGANIQQGPNSITDARLWKINTLGNLMYGFTNVNSQKVMDVAAASTADGANILQSTPVSTDSQKFKLIPNTLGYYTITNVNSNKVVEVVGSSTADGANIAQKIVNGGNNQQWILRQIQ
ncbi:glycosyl hydrolase family 18 protein [Pedobacter psychrodurus]|uniref:glycosyl hydrolase family 18 protein n=1 Tax=Pedobacter psychrodurus TaxID=2530456 RepID=UPI00292E27DE|nr:glycosyl hydrolase family 18 protein [Pedobacter psychrodurus]